METMSELNGESPSTALGLLFDGQVYAMHHTRQETYKCSSHSVLRHPGPNVRVVRPCPITRGIPYPRTGDHYPGAYPTLALVINTFG